MKQIGFLLSFFSFFVSQAVFSNELEQAIASFIEQSEIPRLASMYSDAEVIIELENQASLSYLPACDEQNLSIENKRPNAHRRTTYTLSCTDPVWKSFIPVSQKILIEAYKASTPIDRKQVIDDNNSVLTKVDITQLRGQVYTADNPPFGLVASRNININTFITNQITELAILIKKGQRLLIHAQSGTINVNMSGEAMEDGVLGQQIRVKNISSGRIVYGKVVSTNEILVHY